MKIVIAPDSFKESLSAPDVAEAIARGWRRVFPQAEVLLRPLADGGEGTVDAVLPPPPANAANAGSKARSVSRPWRTGAGWTTPPQ